MPDYDLSEKNSVKVTLYGKIIDENYTRILFEKTDISIEKVVLLDRDQKGYSISKEQSDDLKKDNLIEGRYPKIYVSSNIAKIVDEKAKYMDNKGLDNRFYKDYIVDYIRKFKQVSRQDINNLIYPRLPSNFSEDEKNQRVKYLLTILRKEKIIENEGSYTKPIWKLVKNK